MPTKNLRVLFESYSVLNEAMNIPEKTNEAWRFVQVLGILF